MRHGWFLPYDPTPNEYGSWKQHYVACVHSLDVELSGRTVATASTVSLSGFYASTRPPLLKNGAGGIL